MIRTLVARVLSGGGWAVDTAADLPQARALGPLGYDLLVVDVRLGAERGTDLLAELREQDEAVAGRCLLLSGATGLDLVPPDVAVLPKPFRAEELLAAVNRLAPCQARRAV